MFRIICYPSSGSVERAWLKLLVIFFVCLVGDRQRNFEPAVCVPGKRRIKRHLPFATIIRISPYSPRQQVNGLISISQ